MDLRTLGDTGLVVSRVGLGLAALGRPGYINIGHADDLGDDFDVGAMEARAWAVLDAAWEAGVRYLDAARSYGRGEAFLAGWLAARGVAPGDVTVGSKWGYTYTAGWSVEAEKHEVKDHSVATFTRQWAESRELLGDQIDVYQIHSATLETGVLDDPAVRQALGRLRDSGVRVGLSVTGPRQRETIERALDVEVGGERLFSCLQATWNVLDPSAGPALAKARAAGVGVVVKEALANGRLTARNLDPAFAPRRRLLEQEAARLGTTVDALALAAVLAEPWADVVLSGAATLDQLRSNLGALDVKWDDASRAALEPLAEGRDDYWPSRARLPWN